MGFNMVIASAHSTKTSIFVLLILLAPLGQLSIDFYSINLPTLSNHFHITEKLARLTTLSYMFAFGIGQLLHGFLSDRYGRRYILILSFLLYILSTLLTPLCNSVQQIIFLRFIQGLSIASVSVNVKAIAADIYVGDHLAKSMAWMAAVWGLSPILAPLMGSYIAVFYGWQWCFYVLGFLSANLFLFLFCCLPETKLANPTLRLKTFIEDNQHILNSKKFWIFTLQVSLSLIGLLTYMAQTPSIFQKFYHFDPIQNGFLTLFTSGLYIIGSKISQKQYKFIDLNILLFNKNIFAIFISSLLLSLLSLLCNLNFYIFFSNALLIMFNMGIIFTVNFSKCLQLFPINSGIISGLVGFISLTLSTIILIFVNTLNLNNELLVFALTICFASAFVLLILNLLGFSLKKNTTNKR